MNYEALLKLATDATPGPWKVLDRRVVRECGGFANPVCEIERDNHVWYCDDEIDGCPDLAAEWARTLDYIAAANPQTVAELCRRVIHLQSEMEYIAKFCNGSTNDYLMEIERIAVKALKKFSPTPAQSSGEGQE